MKKAKFTVNPYFFLNRTAVFLKYATAGFAVYKKCEPGGGYEKSENDAKVSFFSEQGGFIFVCKRGG
jgi:hypothetical protein